MDIDLVMCSKQRMFDMGVVLCFKHLVELKRVKLFSGCWLLSNMRSNLDPNPLMAPKCKISPPPTDALKFSLKGKTARLGEDLFSEIRYHNISFSFGLEASE